MTGAGVSVASGIPTYRCKDGFWLGEKKYAHESEPKEICTYEYFNKNPMATWELYCDFYKLMADREVNNGHRAINKFMEHCVQSADGKQAFLMTQNIDGLHNKEIVNSQILSQAQDPRHNVNDDTRLAFTPWVYEVHGNAAYMHCTNEEEPHSHKMVKAPSLKDFEDAYAAAPEKRLTTEDGITHNFCLVPKCEECGAPMKPHVMFFDESYNEHYYRRETIDSFVQESDCLIVVGTAL